MLDKKIVKGTKIRFFSFKNFNPIKKATKLERKNNKNFIFKTDPR